MSLDSELKNRLNQPSSTPIDNLTFGIKILRSPDFTLLTKYQIVTSHVCEHLHDYSADDWDVINEFLALRYSTESLSHDVKRTLVKAVLAEITASKKLCNEDRQFKSLHILLKHPSLLGFFKCNIDLFASVTGQLFRSFTVLLKAAASRDLKYDRTLFEEIMQHLTTFMQNTSNLDEFRLSFFDQAIVPLSELIIRFRSNQITGCDSVFYEFMQALFFQPTDDKTFMPFLSGHLVKKEPPFNFERLPAYSILLAAEAFTVAYKSNKALTSTLVRHLLVHMLKKDSELNTMSATIKLRTVDELICLVQRQNISMNTPAPTNTLLACLSKTINEIILGANVQSNLYEIMSITCSTIHLHPLILESSIFSIITRTMFVRKDARTQRKYEEFLCLVIDMFQMLSRAERLTSHLLKIIPEELKNVKLSKKLKRKLNDDDDTLTCIETTSKKLADEQRNAQMVKPSGYESDGDGDANTEYYLSLFRSVDPAQGKRASEPPLGKPTNDLTNWSDIEFAWPNNTVGKAFSQFIASLMSNPTLVIWKALNFSLGEAVNALKSDKCSENALFFVDITCAILCQFLAGCRLAEHSDQIWDTIQKRRLQTHAQLKEFGWALLSMEHNTRSMNAFLSVCYHLGHFDLLCWQFCPDSLTEAVAPALGRFARTMHDYLSPAEWELIEQRIVNFGRAECKYNINRLYLQRIRAMHLFDDGSTKRSNISASLLSTTLTDFEQLNPILSEPASSVWFVSLLDREQLRLIAEVVVTESSVDVMPSTLMPLFVEREQEFLEVFMLVLFKQIKKSLNNKRSLLNMINFDKLLAKDLDELQGLRKTLRLCLPKPKISKKSSSEELSRLLQIFNQLPIGSLSQNAKSVFFVCLLALFNDLKQSNNNECIMSCTQLFDYLLLLGESPAIFEYVDIENIIEICDDEKESKRIMDSIFVRMMSDIVSPEMLANLKKVVELLDVVDEHAKQYFRLNLSLVKVFCKGTVKNKKNKERSDLQIELCTKLFNRIEQTIDGDNVEALETFVRDTAEEFLIILKVLVSGPDESDILARYGKISKLYLEHMVTDLDVYSVKILSLAIQHKEALDFSSNDIKYFIEKCWQPMKDAVITKKSIDLSKIIKLFVYNKTNEEFLDLMEELLEESKWVTNVETQNYICTLLANIGKCTPTKVKGIVFCEFFKRIMLYLSRGDQKQKSNEHLDITLEMLSCMNQVVKNKTIVTTGDLIDSILSSIIEINLKKIIITDDITSISFMKLYQACADLCLDLIKYRAVFIVDRLPQFLAIINNLVQAICCYRNDRHDSEQLSPLELTRLACLAHKLELVIAHLTKYATHVKRLVPFALLFVINQVACNNRSTTLYPQIKNHIQNICYHLIAICDRKASSFILRGCNDAAKELYHLLHKDYQKYHKFTGKV